MYRYLIDVIVAYEEDGQVLTPDFEEDRLQLQSYKGRRQSTGGGCCLGNEPSGPGVR